MSATARQSGTSNSSSQLQLGDGNFAGTSQHGRSNSAGAMQVGDGNRVRVHQW
ncbi:curlin repeat-containing protein [Bradyrhizobium sp. PMVTL-01]|uniref:curlin repeat-containing protein n=1 Tax=unclassified Bradyrhizobium TaxID=2631580 RepID=UPI003F6F9A6F